MNDPCLSAIAVDPTNDSAWYVGAHNGLYVTKDAGQSWTKPLNGQIGPLLLVPGNPRLIYVGVEKRLFLSRDGGKNWTVIHTFPARVRSVMAGKERLHVGLHWASHLDAGGIFTSNLGGAGMQFLPFGPEHTGLIVWTIARNHQSGTLYAGAEIFDHPQPYDPPFFRSTDGGASWANVGSPLPHHVIVALVRHSDGLIYALTEGQGTFRSPNQGSTWLPPVQLLGPSVSLIMGPANPTHLIGGRQKTGMVSGGIFLSLNEGKTFSPIGLSGVTVASLATNVAGTKLFAATYGSGIYISPIPPGI